MSKMEEFRQAFNNLWHLSEDGMQWKCVSKGITLTTIDCKEGRWVYKEEPDRQFSNVTEALHYVSADILQRLKKIEETYYKK